METKVKLFLFYFSQKISDGAAQFHPNWTELQGPLQDMSIL